jgi:predicted secreted protein
MAGGASRDLLINKNSTALLGINAKSMAVAKEPIDITTDEDNGYRLLLDVAGTKTLDISFSGVTKDLVMRGIILTDGGQMLSDIEIEFPITGAQVTTGDTITGDFFFNGWTENGGGSDGAIEFDGTLQSSGVWTYTPGA